jgi:hypothetical protein
MLLPLFAFGHLDPTAEELLALTTSKDAATSQACRPSSRPSQSVTADSAQLRIKQPAMPTSKSTLSSDTANGMNDSGPPARRRKTFAETLQEKSRQTIVVGLENELEKLYNDFDVLIQAKKAIQDFLDYTKGECRLRYFPFGSIDIVEFVPAPASLTEIINHLAPPADPKRHLETMTELRERVAYDYVYEFEKLCANARSVEVSVNHAIASWSHWERNSKKLPWEIYCILRTKLEAGLKIKGPCFTRFSGIWTTSLRW